MRVEIWSCLLMNSDNCSWYKVFMYLLNKEWWRRKNVFEESRTGCRDISKGMDGCVGFGMKLAVGRGKGEGRQVRVKDDPPPGF